MVRAQPDHTTLPTYPPLVSALELAELAVLSAATWRTMQASFAIILVILFSIIIILHTGELRPWDGRYHLPACA